MNPWIQIVYPSQVPPEGVVIETRIYDDRFGERNVQKLKRRGRMWWFPDDTMYVYYEPTHWRAIPATGGAS